MIRDVELFQIASLDDDVRRRAESLVRRGAVLSGVDCPLLLIGDFRWGGANRILWFPAFGDRAADAGGFSFHEASLEPSRIAFRHSRGYELVLSAIDAAPVDDRDDYRVAWQLWQQVAPLRRSLIERAYAQLDRA
jgi:hypothetical protein